MEDEKIGLILSGLFMSGCVGDLSTCIYDPEYLLTDVMLKTCDVNYDFSYSENGFGKQKKIYPLNAGA